MNEDWLSLEEPVTAKPFYSYPRDPKLPVKNHNGNAKSMRREYLQLKRKLSKPHRDYLNALIQTHFHFPNAHRVMYGMGYDYDRSTLTRWRQRGDLGRAIKVAQEYVESTMGLTDRNILIQAQRLAEHGLDVIPVLNRNGEPVIDPTTNKPVERMRDPSLALKATELLGKNKKLWGDDEAKARVVVELVTLTGEDARPTPIDGEFSEVEQ